MADETSNITQEIIDIAEELGLEHSPTIDPLFYLTVEDKTEDEIENMRDNAEAAGFFFNGFGETASGKSAMEFVYK
ncbi:hypothetical protein ACFSPU_12820 [Haoranjiania flava]|uniref:Uncharacterized protein n=1 Tax=Haoranjiania flava TaxID=1856322 RepID=A0AAE3IQU0_9BACT|nr:hypothetical protein [Haoranjiania flava]MCU7695393.1 hypothetical protein [Haoranjiania flava]